MRFWKPWRKWRCPHPDHRKRCIHGDEINMAGGNRAQCMDCGKFFIDLPYWCLTSRRPHPSKMKENDGM